MTKTLEIACIGYAITADWYEGKSTGHIILVLNGFASSRLRQAAFTNFIVGATDASALTIDYTGHGDSPFELKDTRSAQHIMEVVFTFDWIKKKYPDAKVTVIGNSYGSFLAAHLTHYRSFEKLILRAPAIYKPESLYDPWSIRFDEEDKYKHSVQQYRTNQTKLRSNPLLVTENSPFQGRALVVIHENDERFSGSPVIVDEGRHLYVCSQIGDTDANQIRLDDVRQCQTKSELLPYKCLSLFRVFCL